MFVVSFYTPNGNYPALAAKLSASCDRLSLPKKIIQLPDAGGWLKTNNVKPPFIMSALMDQRSPVLWCDCDAEILAVPKLDPDTDFAIYNWYADRDNVKGIPYDPSRLCCSGGVIYFNYTAAAMELLMRWYAAVATAPDSITDQALDAVYNSHRPPLREQWMSKEFNWMPRLFGPTYDGVLVLHDFVASEHRDGPSTKVTDPDPPTPPA